MHNSKSNCFRLMQFKITHTTEYNYHEPVSLCHNIARLIPRNTNKQQCTGVEIIIRPQPDVWNEYEDFFGNKVVYFAIEQEHKKLTVTVTSNIEKPENDREAWAEKDSMPWEEIRKLLQEPNGEYLDIRQYIPETTMTAISDELAQYALQSFTPGRSLADATQHLNTRIYRDFEFKPGFTTIATPLLTVMKQRKGVCQDFAHLAIACVRSVGLAARYVSGYIETLPPPGKEKLAGVDASHAWFSVFDPAAGWIDLDPTNNQFTSHQHIIVGWGRDYADITPLKGIISGSGPHVLTVAVDVKRIA